MFRRIVWRYKWTFLFFLFLILYLFYKRRKNITFSQKELVYITGLNLLIFIVNFCLSSNLLGCINIAFVLFGIVIMLYYRTRIVEIKNVLFSFIISGLSFVFSFTFSSNTGLDAMSIGFVI